MVTRAAAKALYDNEWQYLDGVETVTYKAPDEAETVDSSVRAKRRGLRRSEIQFASNLGLGRNDQVWTLWRSTMTIDPDGGLIVDADGNEYLVVSAEEARFGAQFVCFTRRKE